MKSSELHRRIRKNGWRYMKAEGAITFMKRTGRYIRFHFTGQKKFPKGCEKK